VIGLLAFCSPFSKDQRRENKVTIDIRLLWRGRRGCGIEHMSTSTSNRKSVHAAAGRFASTQWSLVLAAGRRSTPDAEQALAKLCGAYWPPIYAYLRRRGYPAPEAEDLSQSFFVRLLEKNYLRDASPERGKFRSFLLASLKHFLANEWDRERARKRGGQFQFIGLEDIASQERERLLDSQTLTPEEQFERQWALTALNRVIARLGGEYKDAGKASLFDCLKDFLIGTDGLPYQLVAVALEMSEGAVKTAVHRLRSRFRKLLRAEIAETLPHPDDSAEIDGEIRYLLKTLGS
jgi:RNA polymerase sigma-70 factor (ECF subfamily)